MSAVLSALLITSDEDKYQQILSAFEESQNVEISWAINSSEAITLLKDIAVDTIISDIQIGNLDGWRLARMVRANLFKCPHQTPFFLLTETYCEHIAETTASAFAINEVIGSDRVEQLPTLVAQYTQSLHTVNSNLSVLIVEDDPDIAELAARILKPNHNIHMAATGSKAIELLDANQYDIVLLDVQLPEMSGGEILGYIIAKTPSQAVVIMTAHGGTDMAEQLMIAGAVNFIPKPFKADQLRRVMAIAAHRENYLISNQQFEEKVLAIQKSEEEYRTLSEEHERLLDHLSTVVMELDRDGNIKFVNHAWFKLTGYAPIETITNNLAIFGYGDDGRASNYIRHNLAAIVDGRHKHKKIELQLRTKEKESVWVEAQFNDLEKEGEIIGITATFDNINDRKIAELRLNHLASHDTLTDLYNRHYFETELKRLTATARNHGYTHSLLYLDLDHFKVINDTQGHYQGDIVLKEVSNSLKSVKRDSDVLCRVGGDEFAILLPRTSKGEAEVLAQSICETLQKGNFQFDDRIYKISCSVGVTEICGETEEPETFLQQADIALYVAKRRGRNLVHVYSAEDKETGDFQAAVQWVHTLQEAIVNDQLVLHFQPVIDSETREIEYFEALVRLEIGDELIMPGEFIPALERVEDITLLDHQVISKAVSMMSKHPVLQKVAINLSAAAFGDERLLPLFQEKLDLYGVKAEQIIFEVTESASLTNLGATRGKITELMELGCEFSIDDFGTGFSTFSYLKQIPANCVKIDGSFVKDMTKDPIDMALVKSICEVAKALDKTTVAEFVEDEETLLALKDLGVDYMQGYFISRPLDIDSIEKQFN